MIGSVRNKVAWTTENIETLTILWEAGVSAEAISKKIPYATRNAIIGKAHRLDLTAKKKTPQQKKVKPPIKRSFIVEAKRQPPKPLPLEIKAPEGEGIPFMKAGSKTCRAIVGESMQDNHMLALFCPNLKTEEQSFCTYHQDIYYRKDVR